MKEYKFTQDVKIITWKKNHFSVKAESYEEALKKVELYKTANIACSEDSELVYDTEYCCESEKMVEVAQNKYCPTCELYDNMGNELGNNMDNQVPDDDFLFDLFCSMLEREYFKDKNDEEISNYAIKQFNSNRTQIENKYPGLKQKNKENVDWCENLKDAVIDNYKLALLNTSLFQVIIKKLCRIYILDKAKENKEKPFGFAIDYIKDMYGIPKIKGWNTAEQVLRYFNIDNDMPL